MVKLGLSTSRGIVTVNVADAQDRDFTDCKFASSNMREDVDALNEIAAYKGWPNAVEKDGKFGKFYQVSAEKTATDATSLASRLASLKR